MKRSFLALTAVLVAFGCTEAPTEPELTPSFSFTNGPPTAGVVIRYEAGAILLFANGDGSLVAGLGLGSLDPNQSPICGGGSNFDVLSLQELDNPSDVGIRHLQAKVTVHVWADAATFFSQPTFCDALNLPRLAEGFGTDMEWNNDFDRSRTRTNSFGVRAQGTLDDLVNGGTTQFNLRFQGQIGKRGFRSIMREITLH
jgi:hypothetical protein